MSSIFSVESLSRLHSEAVLRGSNVADEAKRQCEFNFKVTGFNASTVASIILVAVGVFTGSIFMCAAAFLAYQVRGDFYRSLMATGMDNMQNLMDRIHEIDPVRARNEISAYLGVRGPDWQLTHTQILAFKLWMNWVPPQQGVAAPNRQQEQVINAE